MLRAQTFTALKQTRAFSRNNLLQAKSLKDTFKEIYPAKAAAIKNSKNNTVMLLLTKSNYLKPMVV